ncbi:uncharacterized protein LOC114535234 [Dendronephthya gigantea]|uniref:uncharacterized protein LOC114535234 n=1 Tax=Dendronephthya gigantea TaxID=151771 RepID=UPI00106D79B0|nr:uncharacterized protein LOC114535234 [Dendronephthya gigantea]
MLNQNELQFHLSNALQRISELENANISPNNQTCSTNNSRGNSRLTLTEELRRSFPSLANLQSNSAEIPVIPSINSTIRSTQMPLTRASATPFGVNKKKRKRTSSSKVEIKPKAVHKDLVLVPDPIQTSVPTHSSRVTLESDGFVIHSFPFVREWDNVTLKREIEKVFPQIQCCGYEYVKASYGKLVLPNLAPGVMMNCNMLLKLSGQGAVYIRSIEKLAGCDSHDQFDDEEFIIKQEVQEPELIEIEDIKGTDSIPVPATLPDIFDEPVDEHVNVEDVSELISMPAVLDEQVNDPVNVEQVNDVSEIILPELPDLDDLPNSFLEPSCANVHPLTPGQMENYSVRAVTVHRTTIKKDMIILFQDPDILSNLLMFTVVGFNGLPEKGEGVGVARDVLTSFWQQFFDSLAVGVQEKVPAIRHDHQKMEWVAIVRILIYGYIREKYFPISFSSVFIATCLFEEESLTHQDLIQSFRMYISDDERETFDKCRDEELSPNDDEVLELLSSYKCFRIPSRENIMSLFSELAHQELVQKPKYVVHCWTPYIHALKSFPPFQSIEGVRKMYDEKRPTTRKVIKLFKCEPSKDAENQCFDFLKQYVKSLQGQSLTRFLQFTTGSDIIVTKQIKVAFVVVQGFARRPVAHTCAPLLELPSTYQFIMT